MHVVTLKHLHESAKKYPDAAKEIAAWHKIVREAHWLSFADVRSMFPDADNVDGYLVFNIRHNRYRLITVAHYCRVKQNGTRTGGHIYIRSVLTHREYDNKANWDKEHGTK